jgi:hypothetical protein
MAKFELVQRLTDAPDGRPRNIMGDPPSIEVSKLLLDAGAGVDLGYMGSHEYAMPQILIGSANRIANASSKLKVVTRQLVLPGHEEPVSFVCTDEQEALFPEWDQWAKDPHTKEPSGYPVDDKGLYGEIVGWWALGEDLIWARQEETAENIRNAFVQVANSTAPQA